MTEDLNRQIRDTREGELKKMTLCEPCQGIQRSWRRAPGHAELEQGGNRQEDLRTDRYSQHKHKQNNLVTITSYSCARCGTRWEYENNKANQKAGWSVVGR